MAKQRIAVVRHGQKAKNAEGVDILTPKGERQISSTLMTLMIHHGILGFFMSQVLHSGEFRTRQCAEKFCNLHDIPTSRIKEAPGLHFRAPFVVAYGNDNNACLADIKRIQEAGGSVAIAREMCRYAILAKAQLENFLLNLTSEMAPEDGEEALIGFSHSPYASLAAPACVAEKIPFDIGEADAVIYTIEDGVITDTEYIKCPYEGE